METTYHQRAHLQTQVNLVIKNIIFFLIIGFVSCGTKLKQEKKVSEDYTIINKEISAQVNNPKEGMVLLAKKCNNNLFELLESLKFQEENYEFHFLTTQYELSKVDFKKLFGENQINYYESQFYKEKYVEYSKLEEKNISLTDLSNRSADLSTYNNKALIILSYPIYTESKEYSIIGFYSGNYHRDTGDTGIVIYKKENNKWTEFKRILMYIN